MSARNLITRQEATDYLINDLGWSARRVDRETRSVDDIRKLLTREQAQQVIDARVTVTDNDGNEWTHNPQAKTWRRTTAKREFVITYRELADYPYQLDENAHGFTITSDMYEIFEAATHMAHIAAR